MSDHLSDDERTALIFGDLRPDLGREDAAHLALLADTLGRPSAWAEPRAELEDLVVHAVLDADRGAVASVTALRPTAVPQHHARRRPRHRLATVSSIAAAIAAVAVTGGVLANRHETRADFKGVLTATAIAPGAHGVADMYKTEAGFRVELDARGLPKLSGDEYYQAWLKSPDGTEVPIGTFSANGGDVILWSGVSPTNFPMFSVTKEAADNNQNSSGRPVLAGEIRAHEDTSHE
jgi:Anti-sigma-K factor rskA, C-terminal